MSGKGSAKRVAAAQRAAAQRAAAQKQGQKPGQKQAQQPGQSAQKQTQKPAQAAGQRQAQQQARKQGQQAQNSGRQRQEQPAPEQIRRLQPAEPVPQTLVLVPADASERAAAGPGSGGPLGRFRVDSFTRAATRLHSERGPWSVVVDVYTAVFSLGVVLTMVGTLLYAFREYFISGPASAVRQVVRPQYSAIPTSTAISAFTLLGLILVIIMAVRLGPMGASPAQSFWWLNLPVARTSFLRGMLIRRALLALAAATVLALPATLAFQPELNAGLGLLAALAVGLFCVCAILLGALLQIYGGGRVMSGVGFTAAALVFGSFIAEALLAASGAGVGVFDRVWAALPTSWPQLILNGSLWPLAVLLACTLALGGAAAAGLGRLRAADLARSGAVAGHVGASLYFTDFNELGRALQQERHVSRRGRFLGRGPRRPLGALIHAEALTFLRSSGTVPQLLILAAVPVCVGFIAGFGVAIPIAAAVVVVGCWAASTAGVAAKQTAIVPELDALLPLSARTTRTAHAVVPAVALLIWTALVFGSLALLGGGGWALVVMALVAALGLAGASVRGAYRTATAGPANPDAGMGAGMGMMPGMGGAASVIRNVFHGHDVAILSLAPVVVALFTGVVTPHLFLLQLGLSAIALLWGTWVKGAGLAAALEPPAQTQPAR